MVQMNQFASRNRERDVENKHMDNSGGGGWWWWDELGDWD